MANRAEQTRRCLEEAALLVVDRGWAGLTVRDLATRTGLSKSTVANLLPEGERERMLVDHAFDRFEAFLLRADDPPRLHIGEMQERCRALFEEPGTLPMLMMRVAALVTTRIDGVNTVTSHIFQRRRQTEALLTSRCNPGGARVPRLIAWFIGASAVFQTTPDATLAQLERLGEILGD